MELPYSEVTLQFGSKFRQVRYRDFVLPKRHDTLETIQQKGNRGQGSPRHITTRSQRTRRGASMASDAMSYEERLRARPRGRRPSRRPLAVGPVRRRKRRKSSGQRAAWMKARQPLEQGWSRRAAWSREARRSGRSAEPMAMAPSVLAGTMSPALKPGESTRPLPTTAQQRCWRQPVAARSRRSA